MNSLVFPRYGLFKQRRDWRAETLTLQNIAEKSTGSESMSNSQENPMRLEETEQAHMAC